MDTRKLNTTYDFKFADGSVVQLTLSFYGLYQLRNNHKALYERYNKIMANSAKGNFEELDAVMILYTAYVCANSKNENLMGEEEFVMLCGSDRKAVGNAVQALINAKKA